MNPVTAENMGESMSQAIYIMLKQFDTLRCQKKELEYKGGQRLVHDMCCS